MAEERSSSGSTTKGICASTASATLTITPSVAVLPRICSVSYTHLIGGDDYLAKPFGVRELIARVRALLRRGSMDAQQESTALTASGITLDEDRHTATGENGLIDLTPVSYTHLSGRAPMRTMANTGSMPRSFSAATRFRPSSFNASIIGLPARIRGILFSSTPSFYEPISPGQCFRAPQHALCRPRGRFSLSVRSLPLRTQEPWRYPP